MNLNRIIWAVAFAITMPTVLTFVFTAIRNAKSNPHGEMTDQEFIVKYPNSIIVLGLSFGGIGLAITVFLNIYWYITTNDRLFFIFDCIIGPIILFFAYIALKGMIFRVVVSGEQITVHDIFRTPRRFTFSDIEHARIRINSGDMNPESLILKTSVDKRMVVDGMTVEYERLVKRVKAEVPSERLEGYF